MNRFTGETIQSISPSMQISAVANIYSKCLPTGAVEGAGYSDAPNLITTSLICTIQPSIVPSFESYLTKYIPRVSFDYCQNEINAHMICMHQLQQHTLR